MKNSYHTAQEGEADKQSLGELMAAMDVMASALRKDECGLWTLQGSRGYISTWGDGQSWMLFTGGRSGRHWTGIKDRLKFCQVTQDGDEEGVLQLDRLPTPAEAETIRDVLGIRKQIALSDAERERRRLLGVKFAGQLRGSRGGTGV